MNLMCLNQHLKTSVSSTMNIVWKNILILVWGTIVSIAGKHVEISDYSGHSCIRSCNSPPSMVCEYNFTVEYYFTLTKACYECPYNTTDCYRPHCVPADGTPRGILTVNRMIPGPAIHVCEGDTVVVNVHNNLEGAEGVSIHWHGVNQKDFQHMDGVAMLTQCPINARSSFQYKFKPSNPGTHFWHAHSGVQRADGIFGALVVRQSNKEENHLGLYEDDLPEHTIIINDWLVELAVNKFSRHLHAGGDNKPESILINGKGAFHTFTSSNNNTLFTPYAKLSVKLGRRYRMRIISNGILNCPIQFSIDNHSLVIIATDGNPVKPTEVESVNVFAGERYDFVLHTTAIVGNYWIRTLGEADCSNKKAHQHAVLHYESASDELPTAPTGYEYGKRDGKKLNPWNKKETPELIQVTSLESLLPSDEATKEIPDKKFFLTMDFYKIDNYHFHDPSYYPIASLERNKHKYSPQINHISNVLPPAPFLSQYDDIPNETICNSETVGRNCTEEFCECSHLLQVDLGDVVEFIVIDEGQIFNANHPMHLHGYSYRVIGMDKLNSSTTLEEVMSLDAAGKLRRNFTKPVAKDTVTVPDGGYVILRIHATNPGFWFFHCHIEFHVDEGMGLILQVGDRNQIPKPPDKFPKCGNWAPGSYSEKTSTNPCPTIPTKTSNTGYNNRYAFLFCVSTILTFLINRFTYL